MAVYLEFSCGPNCKGWLQDGDIYIRKSPLLSNHLICTSYCSPCIHIIYTPDSQSLTTAQTTVLQTAELLLLLLLFLGSPTCTSAHTPTLHAPLSRLHPLSLALVLILSMESIATGPLQRPRRLWASRSQAPSHATPCGRLKSSRGAARLVLCHLLHLLRLRYSTYLFWSGKRAVIRP